MSQQNSGNHQKDNKEISTSNKKKYWKQKKESNKRSTQQQNINHQSAQTIQNLTQSSNSSNKKKSTESNGTKGPFMLDPTNSTSLNLNLKTWIKNMQIHISTLYPIFSIEILKQADGTRIRAPVPQEPLVPDMPAGNANQRHFETTAYTARLTAYLTKLEKFNEDKLKVIGEIRKYVITKIDEDVLKANPTYAVNPDIASIMDSIELSYQILSIGGNIQQLKQQVEIRDVHMYSGMAALDNAKRNNGVFDLHEHREEYQHLEQERVICKLPVRTPIEQANRFIMSLIHIAKYKLMVYTLMKNEADYERKPKNTDAEIAEANRFRQMPADLSKAYLLATEEADLFISYNDPVLRSINQQGLSYATISNTINNGGVGQPTKKKKGTNKKPDQSSDKSTSDSTKKFCDIHNCHSHNTAECKSLPHLVQAWKQNPSNPKNAYTKKFQADEEPKPKVTKQNSLNQRYLRSDYYDDDDEDNIIPINHMTLLQKVKQLGCRFRKYDAIIDNGCSTSLITMNHKDLITNLHSCHNDSDISTSNGIKQTSALVGDSHCFGKVYYETQDVSILPQSLLEIYHTLNVIQSQGFTLRYELYIQQYDLVIHFNRMRDGIFVANLGCLIGREFIINPQKRTLPIELSYSNFTKEAISEEPYDSEPSNLKPVSKDIQQHLASNKDIKLFEYAQQVVQPQFGFITPSDYEHSVNANVFINAPVEANALRRADQHLGPSITYVKGKSTKKHKKFHFKEEINALQGKEVFHQMDLAYLNELVFLFSTIYPSYYSQLSYLGYGTGIRVESNILPHLKHHYATYKSLGVIVKLSTADGEGAIAKVATDIRNLGIRFEKLSRGQHAVLVDIMIKKWKSSLRCMFNIGIPMIRSLRIGAAMNAIWWTNRVCNTSNPNKESSHYYLTRERLDCSKIKFKFGDLVEAKVEDDIQHNTMNARTITAIVLHPFSSPGTWKIYNLQTRKILMRTDLVKVRMIPDVIHMLKDIQQEEMKRLISNPKQTVVAAIQHKRITDYRELHLPHQVAKYGVVPSVTALSTELRGMYERFGSFIPVYLSDLSKLDAEGLLKSRGMLTVKSTDNQGKPTIKARFIVKGNTQDRSKFEVEDLNSPTVAIATIMQVLVTCAKEKLSILLIDHPQAFLKADQKQEQYVKMDYYIASLFVLMYPEYKEYLNQDGSLIIKLLKAIYGQIDSPMLFYKFLSQKFAELGHYVNPIDRGLFKKVYEDVNDGSYNVVETCTHVDDTLSTVHPSLLQRLKEEFKSKFGDDLKINDDQSNLKFLGMKINVNHTDGTVSISPELFFNKLCDENSDLINNRVRQYPCKLDIFESNPASPLLSDTKLSNRISKIIHQVGYALFMAPELSVTITVLKASVNHITEEVYTRTIYMLQYINGRRDLPLILGPNSDGNYDFTVFADASYNPVKNDSILLKGCKSVSAAMLTLGRGAFHVKVAKQGFVANSSTYAELGAANDAIIPASHQQQLLESRGITGDGIHPGKFKEDNTATIQLIKNGRSLNAKTKHIKLKFYFIKQFFDDGEFELQYCPTDQMIADILTKPIQGKLFFELRAKLLGHKPI